MSTRILNGGFCDVLAHGMGKGKTLGWYDLLVVGAFGLWAVIVLLDQSSMELVDWVRDK